MVNGIPEYTGTDSRLRYTAAAIKRWNDPEDAYNPAVELVQDAQLVAEQGYKETRRGVRRHQSGSGDPLWPLSDLHVSRVRSRRFCSQCGLENADIRPGEVVAINDPGRAGARLAGRLLHDEGSDTITLDHTPQPLREQGGWTIYFMIGSAAEAQKPTLYAATIVAAVSDTQFRLDNKPAGADAGTMFLLANPNVEPSLWRVAVVTDAGHGLYQVLATQWDINKHYYVDYGWFIPEPPHLAHPDRPDYAAERHQLFGVAIYLDAGGTPQFRRHHSPVDGLTRPALSTRYQLELSGPNGDYRLYDTWWRCIPQEVPNMRQGQWDHRAQSLTVLARLLDADQPPVQAHRSVLATAALSDRFLRHALQGGNMGHAVLGAEPAEIDGDVLLGSSLTGIRRRGSGPRHHLHRARVEPQHDAGQHACHPPTAPICSRPSTNPGRRVARLDRGRGAVPQQTERTIILDLHEVMN